MIESIGVIADAWWRWLAPLTIQATFFALLILVVDLLLLRLKWIWPQLRLALFGLILVKVLLPPGFSLPTAISSWGYPSFNLRIHDAVNAILVDYANNRFNLTSLLLGIWLIGLLLLGTVVLFHRRKILQIVHRSSAPINEVKQIFSEACSFLRFKKKPDLLISEEVRCPFTIGSINAVIVLPKQIADDIDKTDIRNIFLHELVHIRRGDHFFNIITQFLVVIFWFNPIFWLVRKRICGTLELCCDSAVVESLNFESGEYKKSLAKISEAIFLGKDLENELAFLSTHKLAFIRFQQLRQTSRGIWLKAFLNGVVVILLAVVIMPMGVSYPQTNEVVTAKKSYLISDVIIQGDLKNLTEKKILNLISHHPGSVFDSQQLGSDTEKLATSGLFEQVKCHLRTSEDKGIILIFEVKEKPN